MSKIVEVDIGGKIKPIFSNNTHKANTYDILLWIGLNYIDKINTKFIINNYSDYIIDTTLLHKHGVFLSNEKDMVMTLLDSYSTESFIVVPFSICFDSDDNVVPPLIIKNKIIGSHISNDCVWLIYDDMDSSNEKGVLLYESLKQYSQEIHFNFPYKFIKAKAHDPNEINITEAESILSDSDLQPVTYDDVLNIINNIDDKYNSTYPNSKFITGSEVTSSPTDRVKKLYSYSILKYDVYPFDRAYGFLDDLVESKFMYPMNTMSLYERIMFMRKMPRSIGYISHGYKTVLAVKVHGIVYDREYVKLYDWDTCEEIPNFNFVPIIMHPSESLTEIVDARELFTTKEYITNEHSVNNTKELWEHEDFKINLDCISKFRKMDINSPISFKNSVLIKYCGKLCLAYFPHTFSLVGSVISPLLGDYKVREGLIPKNQIEIFNDPLQMYEGGHQIVIDEDEFCSIVSIRLALSHFDFESQKSLRDSLIKAKRTFDSLNQIPKLEPALPLDLSLISDLCTPSKSCLSPYDLMLRTMEDVLPINKDDRGEFNHTLINELPLNVIEDSFMTKNYITCFGTLVNMGEPKILPITYSELKGRKIT